MLETNGVTKSGDVKEVIKKQLENAFKRKGGKKKKKKTPQMMKVGLIPPMLITIWNCIEIIIFYGLILGHHEFIFS